ncbi:hypothetical protein Bca52824_095354 [Brassica carinata]|uniref:Hydroxyproline O-arabinosyltransferase-like domain-containing protein n=1 Tax=Brassica carinata TaxID=52824 RepID=A0A8X7P2P1_BRACI|nr:hypothetical protein Bca52824_095354 [Brassica carinata]
MQSQSFRWTRIRMGGFTRILHNGKPDKYMDEIPTFVAQPLPSGMDQGYVVLNRPWAFVQWLQQADIKEDYVLMSEPDHSNGRHALWLIHTQLFFKHFTPKDNNTLFSWPRIKKIYSQMITKKRRRFVGVGISVTSGGEEEETVAGAVTCRKKKEKVGGAGNSRGQKRFLRKFLNFDDGGGGENSSPERYVAPAVIKV